MITFLFYTSLVLIIGFFAIKFFEMYYDKQHMMSKILCMGDEYCHQFLGQTKKVVSKIKFKNFHKAAVKTAEFTKREVIFLKRKFDSKQPKFFLKQSNKPDIHKRGSASFFLKNVSDYKNSLKNKE